jgi:hypothetical protein
VDTGIPYVLLQGMVVRERYRAAITIRHGMVVVLCEEESKLDLRIYIDSGNAARM